MAREEKKCSSKSEINFFCSCWTIFLSSLHPRFVYVIGNSPDNIVFCVYLAYKALVAVILTPTYRGLRSKDDGYNVLHTYPCPTAHCPFYQPLNQLTVHSLTEEGSLLLLLSNHHFSVPTVNRQHQQGVVFLVLRLS